MIIEKIVFKDDNFLIFSMETLILKLCESTFVRYNLYKGKVISEEEIEGIKQENSQQECLDFFLKKRINRKTEKEVRNILKENGYPPDSIDFTINYLEKYSIIDDKEYARLYVRDKMRLNKYGPRKIYFNLLEKGIKKEYISQALEEEYDFESIETNIKNILEKKFKNTQIHDIKTYKKAYNHLCNKGYYHEDISKILNQE